MNSPATTEALDSDATLPHQDGGNYSDIRMAILSTIKEELLKLKIKVSRLMLKTDMSTQEIREPTSDNNGRSCMLMNTMSQRKES